MLKWLDVIKYANKGNLTPDKRVEKTDEEWKALLTEEQYYITRQKGTERANSSDLCTFFEAGKYTCVCCETLLFDSAACGLRLIRSMLQIGHVPGRSLVYVGCIGQ